MFLGQSKNFSAKTILTTKSGLSGQFCGVPSKISLPVKRPCELSEKNAFCMFYLAPTRGATTFRARAPSRNVVAPLVGARRIHRPWPASLCRFTSANQLGQAVNLIQVGNTRPAHQFICTDVSKRLHCPLHCLRCGGN